MKLEWFLGAFILFALIAFILAYKGNIIPLWSRKTSTKRDMRAFYPNSLCDTDYDYDPYLDYDFEEEIDDLDDDLDDDDEDIPWIFYDEL